jgi:hypothetical protein
METASPEHWLQIGTVRANVFQHRIVTHGAIAATSYKITPDEDARHALQMEWRWRNW